MVSVSRTKNTIQKLDVNQQNSGNPANIGTTPVVVYTCPAGKTALVKSFKFRCTGLGAGTQVNVRAKGENLRSTTSGAEAAMIESAGNGIRLTAGQTCDLNGDSGSNNQSGFFDITVQELPA